MPIGSGVPREFGVARQLFAKGAIRVDEDFDAPLPPEMLRKLRGK
jgi:hypothetical protein